MQGNGEARGDAGASAGAATGQGAGYRTSGAYYRTSPDAESVPAPIPGSALGRLSGFAGHAILAARNAIAAFLGKGDRRVAVPILDRLAAAALDWIARRQPEDLALQTARDDLIHSSGRSPASPQRLVALVAGIAVVFLLIAYFACRTGR